MKVVANRQKAPRSRAVSAVLAVSMSAYAACLIGPGLSVESLGSGGIHPGWGLFVEGLIGIFLGYFAWLANPVLWAAWVFLLQRRYAPAVTSAVTAAAFALTFLGHEQIPVGSSGNYPFVVEWAYWAWLASMAAAAVAGLVGLGQTFITRSARA